MELSKREMTLSRWTCLRWRSCSLVAPELEISDAVKRAKSSELPCFSSWSNGIISVWYLSFLETGADLEGALELS